MRSTTRAEGVDVLDDTGRVGALLSPIRRRLLRRLYPPESACALARRLRLPRQKVNYHLRALEKAGFLEVAERRQRRGCVERLVRPTARVHLIDPSLLGDLPEDPEPALDRLSATYLIGASARLVRDVAALRRRAAAAGKRLTTLTLQAEVRFATPADRAAFAEELSSALARLASKYHDDSPGSRGFRIVVGGHPVAARSVAKPSERRP